MRRYAPTGREQVGGVGLVDRHEIALPREPRECLEIGLNHRSSALFRALCCLRFLLALKRAYPRARRMAATGARSPVQISHCAVPCATNISTPETVSMPRRSASCSRLRLARAINGVKYEPAIQFVRASSGDSLRVRMHADRRGVHDGVEKFAAADSPRDGVASTAFASALARAMRRALTQTRGPACSEREGHRARRASGSHDQDAAATQRASAARESAARRRNPCCSRRVFRRRARPPCSPRRSARPAESQSSRSLRMRSLCGSVTLKPSNPSGSIDAQKILQVANQKRQIDRIHSARLEARILHHR